MVKKTILYFLLLYGLQVNAGNNGWIRETIVKEAGVVVLPGDGSKSAPLKSFAIVLPGIDCADFDFLPVASAARDSIGQQRAIFAHSRSAKGNSTIGTE